MTGKNSKKNKAKAQNKKIKRTVDYIEEVILNEQIMLALPPLINLQLSLSQQEVNIANNNSFSIGPYVTQALYSQVNILASSFLEPLNAAIQTYNIVSPLLGHQRLLITLGIELALITFLNIGARHADVLAKVGKSGLDSFIGAKQLQSNPDYEHSPDNLVMNLAVIYMIYRAASTSIAALSALTCRITEMSLKFPALDEQLEQHYSAKNEAGQPIYLLMAPYPRSSTIIPNAPANLGAIIRLANNIFVAGSNTLINGLLAIITLYKISNIKEDGFFSSGNILGVKMLFSLTAFLVSNYLAKQSFELKQKVLHLQTAIREIESSNNNNILPIAMMNAGLFATKQTLEAVDNIRKIETEMVSCEIILKFWEKLITGFNGIESGLDLVLILNRALRFGVSSADISAENLLNMQHASAVFNFGTKNSENIADLKSKLSQIKEYYIMREAAQKEKQTFIRTKLNEDQNIRIDAGLVVFETNKKESDEKNVSFKLSIPLHIPIKDNDGENGSRVLIHGKSGLGKSIILKALANIKTPGVTVSGMFRFPKDFDPNEPNYDHSSPDIVIMPQQLYFPVRVSFLDLLKYPHKTNKIIEKNESIYSIAGFLDSLNVLHPIQLAKASTDAQLKYSDSEILNIAKEVIDTLKMTKRFEVFFNDPSKIIDKWDCLSGGQGKVIPLIWAIIQKPKTLILDETWTGLDSKNIPNVHKLLNKYLSKTTIISVAHHEQEIDINDENCFYTHAFKLDDYNEIQGSSLSKTTPPVKLTRNISNLYHVNNKNKAPTPASPFFHALSSAFSTPDKQSQKEQGVIENNKFILEEVEKDGNCFYHTVARLLNDGRDHLALRAIATTYIRNTAVMAENHPNVLNNLETIDGYLNRIAQPGQWAETNEIHALALALEVDIIVHEPYGETRHSGSLHTNANAIVLNIFHENGNHFRPMVRRGEDYLMNNYFMFDSSNSFNIPLQQNNTSSDSSFLGEANLVGSISPFSTDNFDHSQ